MKTKKRQLEKLDIGSVWVRQNVTVTERYDGELPWEVNVGDILFGEFDHRHEAIAYANQLVLKQYVDPPKD